MFEYWLAIDPGSRNIRMYDFSKKKEVDCRSVQAYFQGKMIATGQKALEYVYSSQKSIQVKYPIKEGKVCLSVSPLIKNMLNEFSIFQTIYKPCVIIAVPIGLNDQDKQRWQEELVSSGIKRFDFVDTLSLLAKDHPTFMIHAGHSYTEIKIVSGKSVLAHKIIHFSGSSMDENIKRKIASKTNCLIHDEDACSLKEAVSNSYKQKKNALLSCSALDKYGKYVPIQITCNELWACIEQELKQIVLWARECYMQTSNEIKEFLMKDGIYLSGGLSQCFGLKQALQQAFDCPIICTNRPECDIIEHMKGLK